MLIRSKVFTIGLRDTQQISNQITEVLFQMSVDVYYFLLGQIEVHFLEKDGDGAEWDYPSTGKNGY